MYMELEEAKIDKEDFEQVEELKPPCVSSWIHPKSGETMHGIELVARKDDAQVDFDDYSNLSIALHSKSNPNGQTKIPKRTDKPDVCSICYRVWTSQGNHRICCLPCGHVYGMSCIKRWFQTTSCGTCPQCNQQYEFEDVSPIYATRICNLAADQKCPQCNQQYEFEDVSPIYATRICNLAADQKAPIRRFSFSRLGYIAFNKYEFSRRNYAWDKRRDALKRHADVVRRHSDAMKRRSELLDRMASVLKRAKALEDRDDAFRRANSLRLRADALGRRADEYLRTAETFRLRAKALLGRARAFVLQINAFKPRLKFFYDNNLEFYRSA
ncbi:zinc finger, RING/FYVE/PHD-type [Artemisia annua]|uniref:Zinc finger, RING/FYVE/PHD-type n=1 Tax=Artemisia annua TaxID=35608 RepID=A0A2U1NV67_ARTAN|nr:zinc finger, RING/FYVE/PHD-type [Artemisia annua]